MEIWNSALFQVLGFVVCVVAILWCGPRMAREAKTIADKSGMGEALVGMVLLAAATSLPGLTTTAVAAASDLPQLAVANGIGSIACQTAFLAFADMSHRKYNLEYSSASPENLVQGALVIILMTLTLLASLIPNLALFSIHPVTPILILTYCFGLRLVRKARENPGWEVPGGYREQGREEEEPMDSRGLVLRTVVYFIVLFAAGWFLARLAPALAARLGLDEGQVGALVTGVVTSLPELVTTISAVQQGALILAVSNILGGNAFDSLFVGVGDVLYRSGSIYGAMGLQEQVLVAVTTLMTGILMLGLVVRQKYGFANIGFESTGVLIVYFLGIAALFAV